LSWRTPPPSSQLPAPCQACPAHRALPTVGIGLASSPLDRRTGQGRARQGRAGASPPHLVRRPLFAHGIGDLDNAASGWRCRGARVRVPMSPDPYLVSLPPSIPYDGRGYFRPLCRRRKQDSLPFPPPDPILLRAPTPSSGMDGISWGRAIEREDAPPRQLGPALRPHFLSPSRAASHRHA